MALLSPGSKASLNVVRGKKTRKFTVKLAERESGEAAAMGKTVEEEGEASLGLTLTPITPEKARRLGVSERTRGLVVTGVDRAGPTSGFVRQGDIIVEVNRNPVRSLKDFQRALGKSKKVLLLIQRGSSQLFMVIER